MELVGQERDQRRHAPRGEIDRKMPAGERDHRSPVDPVPHLTDTSRSHPGQSRWTTSQFLATLSRRSAKTMSRPVPQSITSAIVSRVRTTSLPGPPTHRVGACSRQQDIVARAAEQPILPGCHRSACRSHPSQTTRRCRRARSTCLRTWSRDDRCEPAPVDVLPVCTVGGDGGDVTWSDLQRHRCRVVPRIGFTIGRCRRGHRLRS